MHRKTLLLFVISAMTCLTAYADQIKLKNGDRLTGKVVKSDGKTLTLKADIVGIVSIPVEAIEHISSDQPLYFSIEDGRTVKGSVTTKKDKLEVNTKESGKITVARDAVKAIRSQAEQDAYLAETRTGWLNHWSGFVQTGFSLTAGNSDTQTLTLSANATRTTATDKTNLYISSIYVENSTDEESHTTANAIRGGGRYEVNLNDRVFAFGSTDLESDEFQKLDLRMVFGGGTGWYVRKDERTQLQVFGGGSVNSEDFSDGTERIAGEVLIGNDLSLKVSDRISLKKRFVFFPHSREAGEFRATLDSSIVTNLSKWLAWHVTVSDRYQSNPAPTAEKNDLLVTTGVRLNFKR